MSGDVINLTVIENPEVINLTITEEGPIYVGFYNVALPDPRVALAVTQAQQAASDSLTSANNSQSSAEASAASAAEALANATGGIAGVFYFGEQNTDGSWRFYKDGTDLKLQIRISGIWTTRDTYKP